MSAESAPSTEPDDDVVSLAQAAKALEVSRRTIERLIERNELERVQLVGNRVGVSKRSLVEELERRRHGTGPAPQSRAAVQAEALSKAVAQLTEALAGERRQLTEISNANLEAQVKAARLEAELKAANERLEELQTHLSKRRWWRRNA